jgi:hypothetical protein
MTGNNGKLKDLCKNYDEMTDEGKNELLKVGEDFLNKVNIWGNKEFISKKDRLNFENENRT